MTNKLQKNYLGSFEHSAKLDSDIWNDIKTFFTDNYSEHSIIFTLEDESTKKYIDFDSAAEFIIENDSNIKKIRLFAKQDEEIIKIDYVTGMWTKQAALVSEANHVSGSYDKVSAFHIKLREQSKINYRRPFFYVVLSIYLFAFAANAYNFFKNEMPNIIMFIALILGMIYTISTKSITWGRKKVYILLDREKEKRVLRKKKTINWIVYGIAVFVLILFLAIIIF